MMRNASLRIASNDLTGRNCEMSDWKLFYRDALDQDRIAQRIESREAALAQARILHRKNRAEIYRIEGPDGKQVRKDEIMRWVSSNMY